MLLGNWSLLVASRASASVVSDEQDGTTVSYLALANNLRNTQTGVSKPKILHSFGREDELAPEVLERLIASIARHLHVAMPDSADVGDPAALDPEPGDGPDLGGVWVLDQLIAMLGIYREIRELARRLADRPGLKRDVPPLKRILSGLATWRPLAPSSKLQSNRWICEEVHIAGLTEVDHTFCYWPMDWLLEHLAVRETVFFVAADLR